MIGNGLGDAGARNLGNSVVKLHLDEQQKQLNLVAWFTPDNVADLNTNDLDLSTGVAYLREINTLVACDKARTCYVLNAEATGESLPPRHLFSATTYTAFGDQPPEQDAHSNIHGTPVFWNRPGSPLMYVWGEHDYLKMYRWSGEHFDYMGQGPMHVPLGMPGGILALSANAEQDGTGIVWAAHPYTRDANQATVEGILRAFDANDVSVELWNSQQESSRDRLGKFAKFCPPVAAHGKVYMATFADPISSRTPNQLVVYGQLPMAPHAGPPEWLQADVGTPQVGGLQVDSGIFTVTGSGWDIEWVTDEFHFVYQRRVGDCSITARVMSLQNTHEWAKAGAMIRRSLDSGSAHAMTVVTLTTAHGVAFQARAIDGDIQSDSKPVLASTPCWVRVEREADQLSGSASEDGIAWTKIGEQTINFGAQVLVGLAVTCHHTQPEDLCSNTAVFDQVTVTT